MAALDVSGLNDDDLEGTLANVRTERLKRNLGAELESILTRILTDAKNAGITRTQAQNYLTRIFNGIYPPA